MNNKWYNIPRETKQRAYTQISEETGIVPFAVEKDWWVVQILSAITQTKAVSYFIFKGGTSLSKVWKLIERFSEDIDLVFDAVNFEHKAPVTRSGVKSLRKRMRKYISCTFKSELEKILHNNGFTDVETVYIIPEASDADPIQIEVYYPNVVDYPGYIRPRILLEISCTSLNEPCTVQSFGSLLDEYYFESSFVEGSINVQTVIPERTFLEKIFLLHEEFQRPRGRIRVERQSRHLYDVFKLIETEIATNAVHDQELYERIVRHRYLHNRISGVDYNLHQPQSINPLPLPELLETWKEDYLVMQEQMIYGDSPKFSDMLEVIRRFTEDEINSITWTINTNFF